MQTFLEYLLTHYMGEPLRTGRSLGESYWYCPVCGHHRFHTLPDVPDYKHRARCWKCGFGGDDMDMLAHFHPDIHKREHFVRRDELRYEWEQQEHEQRQQKRGPSLPLGRGVRKVHKQ